MKTLQKFRRETKAICIYPVLCLLFFFTALNPVNGQTEKSGLVSVNGLEYYYEIHGKGDLSAKTSAQEEPLLLLHGGLGTLDLFKPILPELTESRQVIAVDLHGHGRTALGDRKIDLSDIGDDLSALLGELGYEKVDILGYSFGGGAAFRLAVQHPDKVGRAVLVSAGFSRDGFFPEILAQQAHVNAQAAEMMKETPMYQSYVEVAPHPEDFPKLLDRMGELMSKPYDWSEDVKELEGPVMLIFGDSDMYRPEHIIEFYQLLGGGLKDAGWTGKNMSPNRLAILPGFTHYNIFLAPEMVTTAMSFLNDKNHPAQWSGQTSESK